MTQRPLFPPTARPGHLCPRPPPAPRTPAPRAPWCACGCVPTPGSGAAEKVLRLTLGANIPPAGAGRRGRRFRGGDGRWGAGRAGSAAPLHRYLRPLLLGR